MKSENFDTIFDTHDFAAHMYLTDIDPATGKAYTGFITVDAVPLPPTIVMLATLLVPSLGIYWFRRRNAAVAA